MSQDTKKESLTIDLNRIALTSGFSLDDLFRIWSTLPIGDQSDITYLEAADQCILELSDLVDSTYPGLSKAQRVALKLQLMGKLLQLKGEHLS